ncbi:MAG: TlyA family RNA methyltransferase [Rhizomicrobium sp.]|jgi:23S rRNA (cytidine1920-2'-O)/16S rRNA (cytidine1409-2'-O)-methyltransferase
MTKPGARLRADLFLVRNGFAASRAEAQAAIAAGRVLADGCAVLKPSQPIADTACIAYEKSHPYVSRAALKLIAALDRFSLSPQGLVCLDLGASTGGFTQVLLERGAAKVYAVDVGHGQLHADVTTDSRVLSLEGVNARDLSAAQVPERPQAIVADVSFIGLKLALPPSLAMAAPGAWLVALVKPQFEAGRSNIGKGGIVRNEAARNAALDDIVAWISSVQGWSVIGHIESPIEGGDGNVEFLVAARKS